MSTSCLLNVTMYTALLNIQALHFENLQKNLMSQSRSSQTYPLEILRNNITTESAYKANIRKRAHLVPNTKSIMLWNKPFAPLEIMFNSRINFCPVKNCALYTKRYLKKILEFDAIIICENSYIDKPLPRKRSKKQKYIYLVTESTANHNFTNVYNNILINWVMSYRLTSDIKLPYISIYDKEGRFVGPKINMTWIKDMKDISPHLKQKLNLKIKLGAIFVSNCGKQRMGVVKIINKYLRKHNLHIDVFGACGTRKCHRNYSISCDAMLERDYFFYLSFENSFAVDYVTEKLTRAVHTHTVPVVLGGADYSRFMPPGSYINACDRDPAELAETLVRVMSNWTRYYEYFRFTNHYEYRNMESYSTFACDLCEMLNDKSLMKNRSRYSNLDKWYTQDYNTTCQK